MAPDVTGKALSSLVNVLEAGRPLIYVQSPEEDRVAALVAQAAETRGPRPQVYIWSLTEGLRQGGKAAREQPAGPREVLDFLIAQAKPAIVLLKDFHEAFRDSAEVRRRLRDVYYECLNSGKHAVICSPVKLIPPEIERETAYIRLPMPDVLELENLLRVEAEVLAPGQAMGERTVYVLSRAMQGLSFNEARHALRFGYAEHGKLDEAVIPLLQEEKRLLVRRTGLMEFVPNVGSVDEIGGLSVLKTWLKQRRELFYSRESISAEIVPKGVMLMGVSGCGKSLSARAVAGVFGLALYRVDMSQIFSAGLGHAERLFAEACRTMEEVAPAVVWFDEIENGISRAHQDSSGVLDRIFGYFLTWMQEKPNGVFVAATANRIDLLPAEMIRKGRFDQVFFIDLPDKDERLEIFRIHLSRRGIDPSALPLDLVVTRTEGWTGAEIEQCVISAVTSARIAGRPAGSDDLFVAMREIVPLSKTMKEQVAHIRSWAYDRAVRASTKA